MRTNKTTKFRAKLMSIASIKFISTISIAAILVSCSGGGDNGESGGKEAPLCLTGTVSNAVTGQPLQDAMVSTEPPTEQVTTGSDGVFVIDNFGGTSGEYEVRVDHVGFEPSDARVTANGGSTTNVNFTLTSSRSGLVPSTTILQLPNGVSSTTFRLTSTVAQTNFYIQPANSWLTATPTQGLITNGETFLINVSVNTDQLSGLTQASSELVINTDNETTGAIISVQVVTEQAANSELGPNQMDCRRPDVLRVGYNDPIFDLVQFLPSAKLPEEAGIRQLNIADNPALFDSLSVSELGLLSITHLDGEPANSTLALSELDTNENIVELVSNMGINDENTRAALSYAVLPGVYCYYLGPTVGFTTPSEAITLDIEFTSAQ